MARRAEPGISYYPINVNHVSNNKIKLLFNEFNSDGYWIWSCLIDRIYAEKGYYFDMGNEDDLELFATDVCKKRVSLVKEVIEGCVRRGLFDKPVFDSFQILTSGRIQENYLEATYERRRKGCSIVLIREILLISLEEKDKNLEIVGMNAILPRKKSILPRSNPQSKVEERKEEPSGGGPPADVPPELDLKDAYKQVTQDKKGVHQFIKQHRPDFIEPYVDYWNLFAKERGLPQVEAITDLRKKKFKVRHSESLFDFTKIIFKAKSSEFLLTNKFFSFDWIFQNESNYLKVIEGNYDNKPEAVAPKVNGHAPQSSAPPLTTLKP